MANFKLVLDIDEVVMNVNTPGLDVAVARIVIDELHIKSVTLERTDEESFVTVSGTNNMVMDKNGNLVKP